MAGYLGQSQPVAAGGNSVETDDIIDGAVTADKLAPGAAVPSQSTHGGKFLTTDGTDASWATVDLSSKFDKAGGTLTGDLNLGDNVKAKFGTGSDLQIYHSGSSSFIRDMGDGDLQIFANDDVYIRGQSTNNYMARFAETGAVTLYHNNSAKLATTSTGINVTGSVTCDGLLSEASTKISHSGGLTLTQNATAEGLGYVAKISAPYANESFKISVDGNKVITTEGYNSATKLILHTSGTERMRIDSSGNVGIGTSSPVNQLEVGYSHAVNKTESIAVGSIYQGNLRGIKLTGAIDSVGTVHSKIESSSSSGNIEFSGGITFNGDTAAANALDDYEEGTWTPDVPSGSLTVNKATYVKIGKLVHVYCYIGQLNATNDSTVMQITGLPYICESGQGYHTGSIGYSGSLVTQHWGLIVTTGNTHIYFHQLNGTGATITRSICSQGDPLLFHATYHTA